MKFSMNRVELIGNVGKIESKPTKSGTSKAVVSIATDKTVKNEQGGYDKETVWHNVNFFGKQAEHALKYVQKGNKLHILGELSYYKYEKDGKMIYKMDIIANDFIPLLREINQSNSNYNQTDTNKDLF